MEWELKNLQEDWPVWHYPTHQAGNLVKAVRPLHGSIRINGWQVRTQQIHKFPRQSFGFSFNGRANMQSHTLD